MDDEETKGAVIVIDPASLKRLIRAAVAEALDERADARAAEVEPEWTDAEGAGRMLGVHPRTVKNMASRGELPASRVGKLWRFRRDDVLAYLERGAA